MNLRIARKITALPACAALAGALLAVSASPAFAGFEPHGLTGTWRVSVQTYSCASGVNTGVPFQSLLTFGADGTLVESTENPGFEPGQRTAGHGVWYRTGWGTYRAVSEAFITFSSAARGPVPAFTQGVQRIEQNIEFSAGGALKAEATITFTDLNGTLVAPLGACATATATRIPD
jgi:hypothetical protein